MANVNQTPNMSVATSKRRKKSANKPTDILELEKYYGINLEESKSLHGGLSIGSGTYKLDNEGNVTELDLYDNNIPDIKPILRLIHLEHINLTRNNVKNINGIDVLIKLRRAYLGANQIVDISPLINCSKIEVLSIFDNPIKDLSPIRSLPQLASLYTQRVEIESFDFLEFATSLNDIGLSECNIRDLDTLPILNNILSAQLDNNFITDISILADSKSLSFVDLSNNLITNIPVAVAQKFDWLKNSVSGLRKLYADKNSNKLHVQGNPLVFPPSTVIELGVETVKDYYTTAKEFGHAPLSEGRIIIVGDGSAGKSSLIERILYNSFDQNKSQTNGIRIENWPLQHKDGRDLVFHLWDFGGQEIQHAVHKFFFTEGCLYVLVLDSRKEEEPEYWLQQIESLGGSAPVLVVFNKQDENPIEIADRKLLKEKYPNIVGFHNVSCKSGYGTADFKQELERESIKLRTVDEQFPNNWFSIKKALAEHTSGEQHYIDYDAFKKVCIDNNVTNIQTQKLLLKYFTTIGAVTWFGDTFLQFLHVLSPAWITQGVYKIITSKITAASFGHIKLSDFSELLQPSSTDDYTYDSNHFGYILSMMKKFDLCYTADDENILLPSSFGKVPKVEYSDFRGNGVRTYILEFKDYMPIALIHKFIAKKISVAYDGNYWYSGIVIQDDRTSSLAMVHADKEAKRIYIRIKGESPLAVWEHIRRELSSTTSSYAQIPYTELILLEEKSNSTVSYDDLVSHIKVNKADFFHPKLGREFEVRELIGFFESKKITIDKFKKGEHTVYLNEYETAVKVPKYAINILNNITPIVNANVSVNINLEIINKLGSDVKSEAAYLLGELGDSNKALKDALAKVVEFGQDAKIAKADDEVKEKGWARKLKGLGETLGSASKHLKNVKDGGESMKSIMSGLHDLATHFNMHDVAAYYEKLHHLFQ